MSELETAYINSKLEEYENEINRIFTGLNDLEYFIQKEVGDLHFKDDYGYEMDILLDILDKLKIIKGEK